MNGNTDKREAAATKQAVEGRDERGRFAAGNTPKTGFHTNPERRNSGSWKKENTPRAKLEKMLSDMTVGEFLMQINDENIVANLEAKIGDVAVSERLANAFIEDREGNGRLKVNSKEFDSLLYFVYGHRTENGTTITTDNESHIIKGFVIPTLPEHFIDKDIIEQLGEEQAAKYLK